MDKYHKCYNIFIESNHNSYRNNGSICDHISIGDQRPHPRQMLPTQSTNFIIEPSSISFKDLDDAINSSESDIVNDNSKLITNEICIDIKKYLETINDSTQKKEMKHNDLNIIPNNNITSSNEYSTDEFDWLTRI